MPSIHSHFKAGPFAALALSALLSACATHTGTAQPPDKPDVSAPPPPRVAETATQRTCNADPIGQAVGEALTEARAQELASQSGARDVRVLPPDSVATMDYREDRLNIELDDQGRITTLRCG
ncbi:I78 family peptidase inhibitor [Halomonas sp. HNIBRBA4712]|uniref:I78 family peptidase inhibitor n=1 Tax=Halomonas sp. HNIBRBA4712 TaxID=3373087 RepID=UPI003747368D